MYQRVYAKLVPGPGYQMSRRGGESARRKSGATRRANSKMNRNYNARACPKRRQDGERWLLSDVCLRVCDTSVDHRRVCESEMRTGFSET